MLDFVILLLVLSQFKSISSLSCPIPCHLRECPNEPAAHHCQSGQLAKDLCGCCDVCAKAEGEECGGPFGSSGTCANYLDCEKRLEDDFNEVGVCRAKVGSQCCDSLERGDDNSQGFAWSRVYGECPQNIGARWRYF